MDVALINSGFSDVLICILKEGHFTLRGVNAAGRADEDEAAGGYEVRAF